MTLKNKLLSSVAAILLAASASADPDHMIIYLPSSGKEPSIAALGASRSIVVLPFGL
jgi:hypothetical protein